MTATRNDAARQSPQEETPLVSVLIPVWNEAATIGNVLQDLGAQTVSDFDVIVVDAGSEDDTLGVVREFGKGLAIKIIEYGSPTTPGQLNAALEASRARYVARVDGHMRIPANYLETVLSHLERGYAAVGVRKTADSATPFGRVLAEALNSGVGGSAYHYATDVREVDHVPYAAYNREMIVGLGGWDERFLANQDVELDHRVREAGGKVLLDGTIETKWKSKGTPKQAWRQYWRYGRGRAMTVRKHRETLKLRHAVLPAISMIAPAALAAGLAEPPLLAGVLVHPAAATALAFLHRAKAGKSVLTLDSARLAAALLTTQTAWGLSFAGSILRPRLLSRSFTERRVRSKRSSTYA